MYQALYRKYRPRCFRDVAGQEHVTETLRRQIIGDRLSHAYLFVGTRGTGKTTCAKILSRAVNCLSPVDGEPCNNCKSCEGIENGSILDVLELDAASNNGVDNVRALREEAIYTPASVKKRVYIVDEVHMLSNAAFNALLKILEEPPEHLVFILATTELHKVPATILSRCQRFSFKRLSSTAIAERLNLVAKNESLTLTPDAAEKLAALADGSMRDGLSLLDQCASDTLVDLQRVLDTVGLAGQRELLRLAGTAANGDIAAALCILDSLYNDGRDMTSLLNELASLVRDLLIYKLSPGSPLLTGGFGSMELSGLSKKLAPERLLSCLDTIKETIFGISRGGNAKLSVEMCLVRMCDERLSDNTPAIIARIAKLETAGAEERKPPKEDTDKGPEAEDSNELPAMVSRDGEADQKAQTEKIEEGNTGVGDSNELPAIVSRGGEADQKAQTEIITDEPEAGTGDEPPAIVSRDGEANKKAQTEKTGERQEVKPIQVLQSTLQARETGDFWADILGILKDDVAIYSLLSDSSSVQAELQESVLIIRAASLFTVNTIESKMFSESLKEAACKALGREVIIRVEAGVGGVSESKRSKLERLSAFNIIEFE